MPSKAKRKLPPSRIRYEERNPTVSCRVPQEIYDRLVAAKEVEGKSFADILKIGLGEQEVQAKKVKAARQQGRDEGYKKGYAEAESRYKVTYHCSQCRQPVVVDSLIEKEAIDKYMSQGWH